MTSKCYIYGLVDPRTDQVRYVGKTAYLDPYKRLGQHIREARGKKNTHKNNWILVLLNQGLRPSLVILEVIHPWQDWQEREKYWITHYRQQVILTNIKDGGEGVAQFEANVIQRMSSSRLGIRKSEDHKRKIGNSNRNPSAETRQKMGEWQKGRRPDKAIAAAIRANTGKVHTPEHNAKAVAPHIGAKRSEQTKARMRDAWVLRKQREVSL